MVFDKQIAWRDKEIDFIVLPSEILPPINYDMIA